MIIYFQFCKTNPTNNKKNQPNPNHPKSDQQKTNQQKPNQQKKQIDKNQTNLAKLGDGQG